MEILRRLLSLFRKNRTDGELDAEIRHHIEMETEALIQSGMTAAEARAEALKAFGSVEGTKESARDQRGFPWLEQTLQDLRIALRGFSRSPGLALNVILILAVGIGASTAVFSVVDRILFRAQPYAQPSSIVSVGFSFPIFDYDFMTASTYRDLQHDMPPFSSATSWGGVSTCDITENSPLRLKCALVESSFLPFLGVQPILGRGISAEEDLPNAPRVAVVSYSFWKSRFGGHEDAIGKSISLDTLPVTVIGVLPDNFELPNLERADVLLPLGLDPKDTRRGTRPVRTLARLKPGVSAVQARPMLQHYFEEMFRVEIPARFRNEAKLAVRPLREVQTGTVHGASWTLLAAVLVMLLIACGNAANLLLARAVARQREFAVRAALGAGRRRLIRQILSESLLLSAAGAVAGSAIAWALLKLFVALAPAGLPYLASASLDLRVLAFALSAAVLSGFLFGSAPALIAPHAGVLSGQRVTQSGGLAMRRALVGGQIALSLALMTSAALLLESLWRQQSLPLGLSADRVVAAEITLSQRYQRPEQRREFFDKLHQRLAQMPGVQDVAEADSLPPGGVPRNHPYSNFQMEGKPPLEKSTGGIVVWRAVSSDYFHALRIPILRGRAFTDDDLQANTASLVLGESLSKRLFPGEDPLGKKLKRFPDGEWYTVVGVARDVRNAGLSARTDPEYYIPRRATNELNSRKANILLRGDVPAKTMESWIRAEVASLDPTIPVVPKSLDEWIGELAARPRFNAYLLTFFACVGLMLSAAGLYALVAYLAAQKSGEIGVRLALGATPEHIRNLMLGTAGRWIGVGLVSGLAISAFAARALRGLLFQAPAFSPAPFASAAGVLMAAALLAAWLPAKRASRISPMTSLRHE